jgi:hypothetical protein
MFTPSLFTADLQSARSNSFDAALPNPREAWLRLQAPDPIEQMALADAADRGLLRLVGCAAVATLLLALATSML